MLSTISMTVSLPPTNKADCPLMHCRLMGMSRKFAVCMREDTMMMLPGGGEWVNMYRDIREIPQMVQQLMLHLSRDLMTSFNGQRGINGDIDFG